MFSFYLISDVTVPTRTIARKWARKLVEGCFVPSENPFCSQGINKAFHCWPWITVKKPGTDLSLCQTIRTVVLCHLWQRQHGTGTGERWWQYSLAAGWLPVPWLIGSGSNSGQRSSLGIHTAAWVASVVGTTYLFPVKLLIFHLRVGSVFWVETLSSESLWWNAHRTSIGNLPDSPGVFWGRSPWKWCHLRSCGK